MDSQRQKKVSTLIYNFIKKEIGKIIDSTLRSRLFKGVLVSVTKVKTTPDLSKSKIYLSIFPSKKTKELLNFLIKNKFVIKQKFIDLARGQLRIMPDIEFLIDNSLDYIESIENVIKNGGENPIKN